jgi:hypothetical protein
MDQVDQSFRLEHELNCRHCRWHQCTVLQRNCYVSSTLHGKTTSSGVISCIIFCLQAVTHLQCTVPKGRFTHRATVARSDELASKRGSRPLDTVHIFILNFKFLSLELETNNEYSCAKRFDVILVTNQIYGQPMLKNYGREVSTQIETLHELF